MLARTSKIKHPLGFTLETPVLIPSFSSKGFGFNKDDNSEINKLWIIASEFLTETTLLSAYDLYYSHIKNIEEAIPEIFFVDSGGYEISNEHDLSTIYKDSPPPKEWSEDKLKETFDSWPSHRPAVFVILLIQFTTP